MRQCLTEKGRLASCDHGTLHENGGMNSFSGEQYFSLMHSNFDILRTAPTIHSHGNLEV